MLPSLGPRLDSPCQNTPHVKATQPYWDMEGGKLRDLIAQTGTPMFSYTSSTADMSWPDLHKLMPDDPFTPGLTPSQSSQICFHNLVTNAHIVATYLSTKHQLLLDTVLQHLDVSDNTCVSDFWYRSKWQACFEVRSLSIALNTPSLIDCLLPLTPCTISPPQTVDGSNAEAGANGK